MSKRVHSMKNSMKMSLLNTKTTEEIIKDFKSSINKEIDYSQFDKNISTECFVLPTEMEEIRVNKGNSTQDILQRVLNNCNSKNKKRTFAQIQYNINDNIGKTKTRNDELNKRNKFKKDEVVDAILNTEIIDGLQNDKTPINQTSKKPLDSFLKNSGIAIEVLEKAKKEKPFKPPTIKPPTKSIWSKFTDLFN
jgi:hypothetical protein